MNHVWSDRFFWRWHSLILSFAAVERHELNCIILPYNLSWCQRSCDHIDYLERLLHLAGHTIIGAASYELCSPFVLSCIKKESIKTPEICEAGMYTIQQPRTVSGTDYDRFIVWNWRWCMRRKLLNSTYEATIVSRRQWGNNMPFTRKQ